MCAWSVFFGGLVFYCSMPCRDARDCGMCAWSVFFGGLVFYCSMPCRDARDCGMCAWSVFFSGLVFCRSACCSDARDCGMCAWSVFFSGLVFCCSSHQKPSLWSGVLPFAMTACQRPFYQRSRSSQPQHLTVTTVHVTTTVSPRCLDR